MALALSFIKQEVQLKEVFIDEVITPNGQDCSDGIRLGSKILYDVCGHESIRECLTGKARSSASAHAEWKRKHVVEQVNKCSLKQCIARTKSKVCL